MMHDSHKSTSSSTHSGKGKSGGKPTGLAALAGIGEDGGDGESGGFSVIDAIGGPRGVVESMLPGFVFVVLFVITSDLKLTLIVSAVLAVLQVVVRLIQRQSLMGALTGLLAVAICLIWAWKSGEARNYYAWGFLTNIFYAVLLLISLAVRVPGVGFLVEFIRSIPTARFKDWLNDWRGDKPLYNAYRTVTWLWVALFILRLAVQVPLYFTNHVTALGTARLLMGIPFWALAIWVSYLIVATPISRHPRVVSEGTEAAAVEEDGNDVVDVVSDANADARGNAHTDNASAEGETDKGSR